MKDKKLTFSSRIFRQFGIGNSVEYVTLIVIKSIDEIHLQRKHYHIVKEALKLLMQQVQEGTDKKW